MQSTPHSYHILISLKFCRHIFEKYPNVIFYENSSSGSRVVPCGRTDMTKLIVASPNCMNAPKKTHPSARVSLIPLYQQISWNFKLPNNQIL